MADGTKIEWTDATWTPIRARNRTTGKVGWHCEHASPGCINCYSEDLNEKRFGTGLPFKPGHRGDVEHFLDEAMLTQPLRWRRPRMVFVCSMTDLFGDWVPDEWIDQVFAVMALAPQHTFQVLTKRADRMRDYLKGHQSRIPYLGRMPLERIHLEAAGHMRGDGGFMDTLKAAGNVYSLYLDTPWPLPNVWAGVSAEDQRRADERIPALLETPAAVRWVSAEPLLGPIDLRSIDVSGDEEVLPLGAGWLDRLEEGEEEGPRLDWIVVGGESGHGARPMHPDWARAIRDQCAKAEVPFLFKQHGAWAHSEQVPAPMPGPSFFDVDGRPTGDGWHFWTEGDRGANASIRVGKKAAGRLLDGVQHDGYPEIGEAA